MNEHSPPTYMQLSTHIYAKTRTHTHISMLFIKFGDQFVGVIGEERRLVCDYQDHLH